LQAQRAFQNQKQFLPTNVTDMQKGFTSNLTWISSWIFNVSFCSGWFFCVILALELVSQTSAHAEESFQAGAATIDITPTQFPAIIAGGFLESQTAKINDRLFVHSIVLDHRVARNRKPGTACL
jgi:hypothetical protein